MVVPPVALAQPSHLLERSVHNLAISHFRSPLVCAPIGEQKDYPELILAASHASERDTPKDREKIDRRGLTGLSVLPRQEASEKQAVCD